MCLRSLEAHLIPTLFLAPACACSHRSSDGSSAHIKQQPPNTCNIPEKRKVVYARRGCVRPLLLLLESDNNVSEALIIREESGRRTATVFAKTAAELHSCHGVDLEADSNCQRHADLFVSEFVQNYPPISRVHFGHCLHYERHGLVFSQTA